MRWDDACLPEGRGGLQKGVFTDVGRHFQPAALPPAEELSAPAIPSAARSASVCGSCASTKAACTWSAERVALSTLKALAPEACSRKAEPSTLYFLSRFSSASTVTPEAPAAPRAEARPSRAQSRLNFGSSDSSVSCAMAAREKSEGW
jgi:hypothetical protein